MNSNGLPKMLRTMNLPAVITSMFRLPLTCTQSHRLKLRAFATVRGKRVKRVNCTRYISTNVFCEHIYFSFATFVGTLCYFYNDFNSQNLLIY